MKQFSVATFNVHMWCDANHMDNYQCWTVGRSSTAVAEDFRPTATATVAEV